MAYINTPPPAPARATPPSQHPVASLKKELNDLKSRDIGASLVTQLSQAIPIERLTEVIEGLMGATTYVRLNKDDTEQVPDWRSREAGAKLYLSYCVGMPVQRQVSMTQTVESEEQTLGRLLASPAARRALKAALAIEEKA